MIIHKVETAPASPQVIIQKAEYICEYCKKSILEDDLVKQNISVKGGYRGKSAVYRDVYYHKACLAKYEKEKPWFA